MGFELEIIRWLQSFSNQFWDLFFQIWTMFGEELVIIAILGFMYWCYDKKIGEALGITVFVSLVLNSVIKVIVHRLRPFQVDSQIMNIRSETANGYSFPSGHTQGAATVFGSLAVWIKKRWLTIVVSIIIVMVALSRMYLGAHFLSDVIVGGLLGVGISFGFYYYLSKTENKQRLYNFLLLVFGIIFVGSYIFYLFTAKTTVDSTNADGLYYNLEGIAKMMGAIFGFVLGVGFEKKHVNFENHNILWKNLLRFVLGVVVVMAIRLALKAVFALIVDPEVTGGLLDGELLKASLAILFDFIRYFAMVLMGIGVFPMLFKKIKI